MVEIRDFCMEKKIWEGMGGLWVRARKLPRCMNWLENRKAAQLIRVAGLLVESKEWVDR